MQALVTLSRQTNLPQCACTKEIEICRMARICNTMYDVLCLPLVSCPPLACCLHTYILLFLILPSPIRSAHSRSRPHQKLVHLMFDSSTKAILPLPEIRVRGFRAHFLHHPAPCRVADTPLDLHT